MLTVSSILLVIAISLSWFENRVWVMPPYDRPHFVNGPFFKITVWLVGKAVAMASVSGLFYSLGWMAGVGAGCLYIAVGTLFFRTSFEKQVEKEFHSQLATYIHAETMEPKHLESVKARLRQEAVERVKGWVNGT